MDWKARLFPEVTWRTYLNHAAMTPLTAVASEGMQRMMQSFAQLGVKAWTEGVESRNRLRELLAQLVNARPEEIGLISNTSHGALIVANEYPFVAGDSMVAFRGEFPGNVTPWLLAAERRGVTVIYLDVEDLVERTPVFLDAMARKPRLLAISWVQYQTGFRTPLKLLSDLRQEFDVHVAVDAIQGMGALVMDLAATPLDFVFTGGHKWMMSPEGTGFLYVHPERIKELEPLVVSWLSQEDSTSFLWRGSGYVDYDKPMRISADRYEMGTMNSVGFAGMEAAVGVLLDAGPQEVERRVRTLAKRCREGLQNMGYTTADAFADAGNVCLPCSDEDLARLFKACDEASVAVATPDGHIRISPHFYNDEADIDRFLDVMHRLR